MLGKALWVVDTELGSKEFERLSTDLLYRQGFRDIVPVEPQDRGRDAEEFPRMGRGRSGEAAFFQFSKEEDWRSKVRRDSAKLAKHGFEFSTLVFVTNRKARGVDTDGMTSEIRQTFGWDLIVFSREWLRLQLEEVYPDLAKKYLGIDIPEWSAHLAAKVRFEGAPEDRESRAWAALEAKEYERAIPELRSLLDCSPERQDAWEALAWCQYSTFDYDGALLSINRVKSIEDSPQALSIRACILAEKGIRDGSRAMLIEARDVFKLVATSEDRPFWTTQYNLGSVLSALGQYEKAASRFKDALALNPDEPTVLKNLASAYHHLGNHEMELELLDKALEIAPLMPEALVAKGICLLVDFQDAGSSSPLLERAIRFNTDWSVRWPQVWYWAALALLEDDQAGRALECVEDGLTHQPGHQALRGLKLRLLDVLIQTNAGLAVKAKPFWHRRLEEEPLDFNTRIHLVNQEETEGNSVGAWRLVDGSFSALGIALGNSLSSSGFSVGESGRAMAFLPQYNRYRAACPVCRYWDQADPLYDLSFPPPESGSAEDALFGGLSVAFGLGFEFLENTDPGRRKSTQALRKFFDKLRQAIERSLVKSAQEFAHLVPSREQGVEAVADQVSNVIMFLGLIALREFGAQRGWIMSQFRVDESAMNAAMDGYDEQAIEANVTSEALVSLNEVVGFVPR